MHIIQRGNNRQRIYQDDTDLQSFRSLLGTAARQHGLAVHAYVSMPNHFHLLATPGGCHSVARTLQSIGRCYVAYFNKRHARTGTLWEGRYRAAAVDSDRYFLVCSRYIELNPVRAGLVPDAGDYAWSSYRHNAHGCRDVLVTPHALYRQLGHDATARCSAYRALFRDVLPDETLNIIRTSSQGGWALGDEAFRRSIEVTTRRRASPLAPGPPKDVSAKRV